MRNFSILFLLLVTGTLLIAACNTDKKSNRQSTSETVLAKAGNDILYLSELSDIIPDGLSQPDSTAFVKRYAESWVRKRLLMDQATRETEGDAEEIDRKVADYRDYLILQAFEKQYVDRHIDTTVSTAEIQDYYKNNPENFTLQQSIVKAWLVVAPKTTPGLDRARSWIRSNKPNDRKELQSFAYRFANFYHLEDTKWTIFNDLIRNTPFADDKNNVALLKNNHFAETSDQQNVYLLAIKEVRLSSQPAPLAFITPQIHEILINRRKVKMLHELENKIYEEAKNKKEFEIKIQ
ncbi:hypothetical protein [Xanthocytophaga agilis]|uniref:Peptidylprolyl isomerase n=1 Tax=Xanthocytophaga agilis TaxID=3048010 RepID=A0AAE3QZS9_9BACT|nr:hypothetical protein [Xanthocytophaga agilis]MDJ1501051.1 hypothetical protein [Xanthocytophaga agilis]